MNIIRKINVLSLSCMFGLTFLFIGFTNTADAQSKTKIEETDIQSAQQLLDYLKKTNPDLVAQFEKEKKNFEKWEKDYGKNADKIFNNQIDKIFGKDKIKASDLVNYIKVGEAIAAGDFDSAGKYLTGILFSCPPSAFGCYMEAWKGTRDFAKLKVKQWADQLYETKSHKLFLDDFNSMSGPIYNDVISMRVNRHMEDKNWRYPIYVPSYMITYMRNNKQIGGEVSKIYDAMIKHENDMFLVWTGNIKGAEGSENAQAHIDALECLKADCQKTKHEWWQFGTQGERASQWREVFKNDLGANTKLTAERQMFNHFLYRETATKKQKYMNAFSQYYLSEILKQAAKKETARIDAQMAVAIRKAIAELQTAMLEAEKADAKAEVKALEDKYRKYLDNGLANKTIMLPMGMNANTAHSVGMKAVSYGKQNYYEAIAHLHALALKQQKERNDEAEARKEEEKLAAEKLKEEAGNLAAEKLTDEQLVVKDDTKSGDDAFDDFFPDEESQDEEVVQVDAPLQANNPHLSPARRACLMTYDFSGFKQAQLLALFPGELRADSTGSGDNVQHLLGIIGEVCKPGYTKPEDIETGDDWDNAGEDLTTSTLTEEEKWAMRDKQAGKSASDAARAGDRIGQQFASIESDRAERARIKAEKRAAIFSALAEGVTQVAEAYVEVERQNAIDDARRDNVMSERKKDDFQRMAESRRRSTFMNRCKSKNFSTTGNFPSRDPNAANFACGQKYEAQKSGTYGSGSTYIEKLNTQKQQAAQRRASQQQQAAADQRRAVEDRKKAELRAKNRAHARKQCACYKLGKSAGQNSDSKNGGQPGVPHPKQCPPSHLGMGSASPWRLGFFAGRDGLKNHDFENCRS